ncbi:hypothetical protein V8C35DRAFT_45527 [Trichoderma chlorosporum]
MRCYIQFVEQMIIPLEHTAKSNFIKRGKIRSNDLWHLFQVGDVVCAPSMSNKQQQATFVTYRKVVSPIANNFPDDLTNRDLTIWCYYVDYDGKNYGKIRQSFTISGYEGERVITDLPIYPLSYAHNHEQQRIELQKHGDHFRAIAREKHVYCQGWTLPADPKGDQVRRNRREFDDGIPSYIEKMKPEFSSPEYIDSDVIIDVEEALKQSSDWEISFGTVCCFSTKQTYSWQEETLGI